MNKKGNIKKIFVMTLVLAMITAGAFSIVSADSFESSGELNKETGNFTTPIKPKIGWIYGQVTDIAEMPLANASVCARKSGENISDSFDTLTDSSGRYYIKVPVGTYTVLASKEEYETSIVYNVKVEEYKAIEVNFILELLPPSIPTVVYVDDDFNENTTGFGYDHFNTIQDGIDAVDEEGTVYVAYGTYVENVVIDKQLDLIGCDKNFVIIDGGSDDHVVEILANDVVISGFTIRNSDNYKAGVLIDHSEEVTVFDNIILDTTYGIAVEFSDNCLLQKNLITESASIGILLEYSSLNSIIANSVTGGSASPIRILQNSNNNTLYHNNIFSCGWEMAYDSGNNNWDNGVTGNYWIYHFGPDEDGDGIIDIPYDIPGAGNQDRFPLVQPYIS